MRNLLLLATILLVAASPGFANAAGYTVTDLGTVGGDWSKALSISSSGVVAGISEDSQGRNRAFLRQDGTMYGLGTLSRGEESSATCVNNSGEVTGYSQAVLLYCSDGECFTSLLVHSFLWTSGAMQDLEPINSSLYCTAFGMNDLHQVVGYKRAGAFLWQDGWMSTFGGAGSIALGINTSGHIVGTDPQDRAVIWRDQATDLLGDLGGPKGYANSINDSGQVVGDADVADAGYHAFLWQAAWCRIWVRLAVRTVPRAASTTGARSSVNPTRRMPASTHSSGRTALCSISTT